jgi:hypothetical protein
VRHAGVGFPNGAVDNAAVFALPSPDILMLSTEGRWHHDAAVRAGKHVTWRAIPRIGKRPAELGWSPARFVAETINLTDAPTLPIADFIPWNELDLQDERGDREDDWSNLERRYALIGGWTLSVVQSLKQWSPGTRIHFGAWTPDHHALDHVTRWLEAARNCDVVDFHAYDSLANIKAAYHAYRNEFSDKPLALTEWHCRGDLVEERRVLTWLAETMEADPLFEAAHFFIWRWHNAPGWWDDRWDIEHNPERLALFMDPPTAIVPEPLPEPELIPMTDYEAFIRDAARKRGIDPDIAVRVANSEGGVTEPARRGTFDTGSSWWAFQLHYGGSGYEHFGTIAGMGNGFTALTGWQPGDPAAWRDATRYALNRAKANGWGAWYGAAHVGIGRWDGIDRNHPWDANAERWDYETAPEPSRVVYNANEPAHAQEQSFDCSQESLEWALYALGRTPADDWLENTMIAEGVMSADLGLLDATGAGLAAFVGRHYGEFGYYANHELSVTFEGVALEGDHAYPLLIGGRAWGHWSGVRGYDAVSELLLLANPAAGWHGIHQTMNRQQFDALGPFSMVRVLHPDLLAPAPEPPAPPEPEPVPDPPPPADTRLIRALEKAREVVKILEEAIP